MAAVSKLYNPFREVQKVKESEAQVKQGNTTGAFSFEIHPSDYFPRTPTVTFDDADTPDFDPFHIAIPEIQTVGSNQSHKSSGKASVKSTPRALRPKMIVKLSTHEEVISTVKEDDFDVTSEITVEGTVYAQVQSSDANRNPPFALLLPQAAKYLPSFSLAPNKRYASFQQKAAERNGLIFVAIPKSDIMAVPIATYYMKQEVKFMPVLVERNITRVGSRVRIAIQVRTRLDNNGDMKGVTILVAVPERVNGNSVSIVRGNGTWDKMKRFIKWKVPDVLKGHSELVVAEADLWRKPDAEEDETSFPVMFRCCSAADPITPLDWKLAQVSGSPAQITVPSIGHTFRVLHRLH